MSKLTYVFPKVHTFIGGLPTSAGDCESYGKLHAGKPSWQTTEAFLKSNIITILCRVVDDADVDMHRAVLRVIAPCQACT